jgi:hypothetical protein
MMNFTPNKNQKEENIFKTLGGCWVLNSLHPLLCLVFGVRFIVIFCNNSAPSVIPALLASSLKWRKASFFFLT